MLFKVFLNIVIYLFSYGVILYFKRNGFNIYSEDIIHYTVIQGIVLLSSFISGKYTAKKDKEFVTRANPYFIAFILSIGASSYYYVGTASTNSSRLLISGPIIMGFIIELIYLLLSARSQEQNKTIKKLKINPALFIIDLSLIVFLIIYIYAHQINPLDALKYDKLSIVIMFIIWLFSALVTHHFNSFTAEMGIWDFLWKHFKGNVLFLAMCSFSIFILYPEGMSSTNPLIIAIVYSLATIIILSFYYYEKVPQRNDVVITKYMKATLLDEEPILPKVKFDAVKYSLPKTKQSEALRDQLSNIYLYRYPEVLSYIDSAINLSSFNSRRSVIIRSSDLYNIEVLPANIIELYVNLHEINDMRRINEYFIKVNSKLINNGIFIGCVEPSSFRKTKFNRDYPYYLANIFYAVDFIWRRIFPKLPFIKNIYFVLSRGKNRVVSLSEILGRLYYCGFETINLKQVDEKVYFICKKNMEPLTDKNPSYGPFVKLKRIGLNGKVVNVYKFRTMSPYSEYLQQFVYENMNLQSGGKFKDDFRITSWGKLLRKYWLDELPMIINWFKGDLKIVGVRPISKQYLSLYSEELKARRIKFKPGLVPPFYYDLPKTFEEIMASEKNYLDSYERHPLITDIRYFFGSFYNIFIRRARSK